MLASNIYKESLIILVLLINLEGTLDPDVVLSCFSVYILHEPMACCISGKKIENKNNTKNVVTSLIIILVIFLILRMWLLHYAM